MPRSPTNYSTHSSFLLKPQLNLLYTINKSKFVEEIIGKLGFNKHYLRYCTSQDEWGYVNNLRKETGAPEISNNDLFSKNHKHIILMQGTKIVGYAHMELKDAIFKQKIIKSVPEHGDVFNQLLEKWMVFIK